MTKPVTIRFTWRATGSLISANRAKLRKYVWDEKLSAVDEPLFPFYAPPWTLPLLRRNEIFLELVDT